LNVFSASAALVVNAPLVVSETIDGEAVIMHHGTGRYFDINGSGALIWQAVEQGASIAGIAAHLSACHDLSADAAEAMVMDFVHILSSHDLVRADATRPAQVLSATGVPGGALLPPVLGVHDDLADMLLLDPIHDVDEVGWPAPRPAA
jgi:hypothetical protein